MTDGPKAGLAALIAAKLVCCGGLVLVATGALSLAGIAGWLRNGGIVWLAIVALAAMALHLWWRHRRVHPLGVSMAETSNGIAAAMESVDTAASIAATLDAETTSPRIEGMKEAPLARRAYGAPSIARQSTSRSAD